MKEILNSLEALFLQFNFRRLFFWLFIIGLASAILFTWESLTGYFFFTSVERKITLLKELNSLAKDGISQDSELSPIYNEIVAELTTYKIHSIPQLSDLKFERVWKFVSGAFLGLAVAIAGLGDRSKPGKKWKSTVSGGVFVGIVLGVIGIFLPTFYSPWVNYLGYPILQVIVIFGAGKLVQKRKQLQGQQQPLPVAGPVKG